MLTPDALTGEVVYLANVDMEKDLPVVFRWYSDINFMRYISRGMPRFSTLKGMEEWFGAENNDGRYSRPMAIRRRSDDTLVGICAYKDINAQVGSCLFWVGIDPDGTQGQGYGTDAVQVMLRYAFREMNMQRVGLEVGEFNDAAQRVYEKCGFQIEGTIRRSMYRDGRFWDMHYMGILREEWEALQD